MKDKEYWEECLSQAADEIGLDLCSESLQHLAEAVSGGHENYGMAFGHDHIPCPVESQAKRDLESLKRKESERDSWVDRTSPCKQCTTSGNVFDCWGRTAVCPTCNGRGRV